MRRKKNSTIYTGKVGAKMRPRSAKRRQAPILKTTYGCTGGPFAGKAIRLAMRSGGHTLQIRVGPHVGHYAAGAWVSA